MVYDESQALSAIPLVVAGCLSGVAVFFALLALGFRFTTLSPYVMPYVVCLLFANLLQAIGAIMNAKWIAERAVTVGGACTMQAALKQAGNVGTAMWSFILTVYVFVILFLRHKSSPVVRYTTLGGGWIVILVVVIIGPLIIENRERGPYFGPSGYWCWITPNYPKEQIFLEYFFEFMSLGISFFLYMVCLLRVRGNLVHGTDGWHLQFVPRSERWRLAVNRDWVDGSMMRAAAILIWFPIAYSILLIPVAIVRLINFGGNVPLGVTIFADTLFNLQGLANFILLMCARKFMTDSAVLPSFSAPRRALDMSSSGVTPFVLPPLCERHPVEVTRPESTETVRSDPSEESKITPTQARPGSMVSLGSVESFASADSTTPLRGAKHG